MGSPLGVERCRRDFGAIGDRPSSLSTCFPSPCNSFCSASGVPNHYSMLGEVVDKKFGGGSGNLDEDSQSDYSGGITPY